MTLSNSAQHSDNHDTTTSQLKSSRRKLSVDEWRRQLLFRRCERHQVRVWFLELQHGAEKITLNDELVLYKPVLSEK